MSKASDLLKLMGEGHKVGDEVKFNLSTSDYGSQAIGQITNIDGDKITVKNDQGKEVEISLSDIVG